MNCCSFIVVLILRMSVDTKFTAGLCRRYPMSLRSIAREYLLIQIRQHHEWLTMTTVLRDLKRELGRVEKCRRQYHRQQREILRLRLLIRELGHEKENVSMIKKQALEIKAQQKHLMVMGGTLRDVRRQRSLLYHDWRESHRRCSFLQQRNQDLELENDNLRRRLAEQK